MHALVQSPSVVYYLADRQGIRTSSHSPRSHEGDHRYSPPNLTTHTQMKSPPAFAKIYPCG